MGLNTTKIGVTTLTYAMKVKRYLERSGTAAKLIKKDTAGGCAYGVEIPDSRLYDVIGYLLGNGIEYTVYK
jgi:hypothetical protein